MIAVIGPVLISLMTALVTALLYRRPVLQRLASVSGAMLLMLNALWLVSLVSGGDRLSLALGHWPLPFAIEFIADRLSAIMILITALLGLGVLVYDFAGHGARSDATMTQPLIHGLLAAVSGTVLTADLFNLYVWFELMLITILGLLVAGGSLRNLEAAFKYLALNLVGTLLFLMAVAFLYGITGQLNFSSLAEAMQQPAVRSASHVYVILLLIAFLVKAAAFPLYFWLPASYHTLPAGQLALIGGLITKVAVYVILRVMGEVFYDQPRVIYDVLGWIAVLTMVSGVLGAAFHWDLRRILAFHIVSQIGYLLLAVALATPESGAAGIFFLVHNILAKAALFLIAGLIMRDAGHYDLRRVGGLYPARPVLALFFIVAGFSLVGIPPSSGFWGKFMLVAESFAQQQFVWGGIALAVGALTLYSMVKIWIEAFWKPHPAGHIEPVRSTGIPLDYLVVFVLVALLVGIGVYPEPLVAYSQTSTGSFW
jgi:multicomponent Na+:H+ antiporter subunit D